jgi:hypothetical protein
VQKIAPGDFETVDQPCTIEGAEEGKSATFAKGRRAKLAKLIERNLITHRQTIRAMLLRV